MIIRIIKVVACFLLVSSLLAAEEAKEEIKVTETLKKVIPSVVMVYAVNYNNSEHVSYFLRSSVADGSAGSGVIITQDGLIITNYHVVKEKPYIKVILNDKRVFVAKLVSYEPGVDLAILKIDLNDNSIIPVPIVSSKNILVGQEVLAIGNPFGIGISVSSGIVSAIPSKNNLGIGDLIQTDALLNPGNSGGALIDKSGNLIGINTFIFSKSGNFSGIGFAIPSDIVSLFINRSLSGKKLKQYWLGLSAGDISNEYAQKAGLEIPKGVVVTEVYKGGPADLIGLKAGDILLQVGSTEVNSVSALSFIVASFENASEQKLTIFRNNKIQVYSIIPELPGENVPSDKSVIQEGIFSKITIANNSYAIAYELNSNPNEQGVVIYNIDDGSYIARNVPLSYRMMQGDIIVAINGVKLNNVKEMIAFLNQNNSTKVYNIMLKRFNNIIEFNIRIN